MYTHKLYATTYLCTYIITDNNTKYVVHFKSIREYLYFPDGVVIATYVHIGTNDLSSNPMLA